MSTFNDNTSTITRGRKQLTIEVKPGFTLPQVIALMNRYEARVEGRQIISYPESASDGFYVLADIVSQSDGQECGQWSELGAEVPAGARCACQCSCAQGCCRQ